jgi:hypothetical protein
MSEDRRKSCLVCAWRANCAKRFSMGDDATLHCPDFSEDVTLRKRVAEPVPPEEEGTQA